MTAPGTRAITAENSRALLPCPFCGSDPHRHETLGPWTPTGYGQSGVFYSCSNLDCRQPSYGEGAEEQAVARWNTRDDRNGEDEA